MALSDKEKHKVIFYLGWSGQTIVSGSTQYNSVVYNRVSFANTEIERIIKGLLVRLEKTDTALEAALCRLTAKEVDGITLNEDEIVKLKAERKRYIRELSDHLDIPIMKSGGVNVGVVC
jgi:hypothetical protein